MSNIFYYYTVCIDLIDLISNHSVNSAAPVFIPLHIISNYSVELWCIMVSSTVLFVVVLFCFVVVYFMLCYVVLCYVIFCFNVCCYVTRITCTNTVQYCNRKYE